MKYFYPDTQYRRERGYNRARLFDEIELLRAGPAGPEGEMLDQVGHASLLLRLQHRPHLCDCFAKCDL